VVGRLVSAGGRYAGRGEFTRRAFLNGKTDLARAEAINQVVSSRSLAGARRAVRNYFGGYGERLTRWEKMLVRALGDLETAIEFGEEEHAAEQDLVGGAREGMSAVMVEAEGELEGRRRVMEADRGVEVALVGPPNAGKSTILNCLLGYERALVHGERGTTRDSVSERVTIGGVEAYVVDTAGIRGGVGEVERMGVERSWDYVRRASVVVWVTAADEDFSEEERGIVEVRGGGDGLVAVVNKTDIDRWGGEKKGRWFREKGIDSMATAAIEAANRGGLVAFVTEGVRRAAGKRDADTIILTGRQEEVVSEMIRILREGVEAASEGVEIMAHHCREALGCLEEFTGKRTTDEILERVFGELCIGK
jgi:tRNA modification GTPase